MRSQRGSASVEFAAVVPLVAMCLLLVAQIGLLVSEQLAIQHAAREGARQAAVTNDDDRARDAAMHAGNLDGGRATVTVEPAERDVGTPVTVRVTYEPALVPFAGAFVPHAFRLHAAATMRTERAP
jgi:Flp pilus assembly protein TadG